MIRTSKLFRNSLKLFQNYLRATNIQQNKAVTTTEGKEVGQPEEIPIHLRPYDKKKYEVPSTKLKVSSGYALLDLEPMPRAKIMKICYIILDKLKDVPAEAMYRIYTEEKLKYIMRNVDETEDIRALEETFGHESIELFIQALHKEIDLVEHMKIIKPWEARYEDPDRYKFVKTRRVEMRHLRHDKPEREKKAFIEGQQETK